VKSGIALLASCMCALAQAGEALTTLHKATLTTLFPPGEAAELAKTLPADREVVFRVHLPPEGTADGVLVFVSPTDSGELPEGWAPVLDSKRLLWIAADGYGNSRLSAQRVLVALMALKLALHLEPATGPRVYVAGFSGGGRIASVCITRFPRHFAGALFIAGADFSMPEDGDLASLVAARRLVFLTGNRDFNQREMKRVHGQYRDAGVSNTLLMDERGFGHELASPAQLATAIEFLDAR